MKLRRNFKPRCDTLVRKNTLPKMRSSRMNLPTTTTVVTKARKTRQMPAASIVPLLVENERPDFFWELKNGSSEERLRSNILYFLNSLLKRQKHPS